MRCSPHDPVTAPTPEPAIITHTYWPLGGGPIQHIAYILGDFRVGGQGPTAQAAIDDLREQLAALAEDVAPCDRANVEPE